MTKVLINHRWMILFVQFAGIVGLCSCSDNSNGSSDETVVVPTNGVPQQIQDEITTAALTATNVRPVRPVLKCVDKIAGTTTYRAHFGYTNTSSSSISIPVGFFNRFYPAPSGRSQPTVFAAGSQTDVIQIVFSRTSSISWILGVSFQTATASSKLCPVSTGTGGTTGTGGAAGTGGRGGGSGGTAGSAGNGGAGGVGGTGAGGAKQCPSTCDDHNPCTTDTCNASTGFLCANVAGPDGIACTDNNACTTGDRCAAGVCVPGTARVCAPIDQCHIAGVCDVTTGACSTPVAANGTSCSDGSACTTGDVCQNGTCAPGAPKICTVSDQCHVAGVCAPASGVCSNPAAPDGSACNDGLMCTVQDACLAGVCTPAATLPPTHCVGGSVCDDCTTNNCVSDFAGCDQIADSGDRQLCENLYSCFTNPANNCTSQGDTSLCWCGTNSSTCYTDNSPPTQANGPCLQQIIAAAKTSDAATIKLRLVDPSYPIGRAVNLTVCRGEFCTVECSVP